MKNIHKKYGGIDCYKINAKKVIIDMRCNYLQVYKINIK